MSDKPETNAYWAANIKIVTWCLVIWAVVPFLFGILLQPVMPGFAFWVAQQGSILVFLAIIFFYAWRMNRLDAEHGVDEQ